VLLRKSELHLELIFVNACLYADGHSVVESWKKVSILWMYQS